jgi:probable F420-dependent oxidoreductase
VTNRQLLGPLGVWSRELRYCDPEASAAAAAELEQLGFDALWVPDVGGPVIEAVERLLAATTRVSVATGILNVWMHEPAEVAAAQARLEDQHPGRFLLGLGIGHAAIVDAGAPGRYARPLSFMRGYLDALDAAGAGPRLPRVLAALAPKMLALARERADGIHPYLVPVEHTAAARTVLGPAALIAQELTVVLEPDPAVARRLARADLEGYLALPNYTSTWRRLGYGDDDLADGGSDRLVDALYAHGTVEAVAARIAEYRSAGADHVCLRVVVPGPERLLLPEWRTLAALVTRAPPGTAAA